MVLETNTFLMVFGATVVVLGLFIWLKFRAANRKVPQQFLRTLASPQRKSALWRRMQFTQTE